MLGLSLIAALQPAVPDPPVRWTAPAGCPDQSRVQSQIDTLLSRPLDPNALRMDGVIEATSSGWRLTLTTRVGTLVDERSLDANDCSVLADAAALVAVVMLDPVQAAGRIEEEAEAAEAARNETTVAPRPEPSSIPTPEVSRPAPEPEDEPVSLGLSARVRGGGEFGAVPRGTGSFDLGVALVGLGRAGRLRAELVGLYSIGRETTSPNAAIRVHLGAVAPRFCAALPAGPVEIPLCGGVELGAMRADANAPANTTTQALWLAAHAEPGVRWAFANRVSLWVSALVVLPMRYPEFELVDATTGERVEGVYRPQPVSARGLLGFEFQLRSSSR